MRDYCLVVGSSANFQTFYYEQRGILCFDVPYTLNNQLYDREHPLPPADFYARLRDGQTGSTPAPSLERAEDFLRQIITERDEDLIVLTISSKLGYINDVMHRAAHNVGQEFPDYRITIIDTLCAALGEGLLVNMAAHFKQKGFSYDENIMWIERLKHHVIHFFFTEDLNALQRNHKIPRFAAFLGIIADLKVLFHVDKTGAITPFKLISSRKYAMKTMVENMGPRIKDHNFKKRNKTIYICHGDCEKDAIALSQMIRKEYGYTDFVIEPLHPILGAYAGPGTLAVFFIGSHR